MSMIEYFDRPPSGWFVLDVMKQKESGLDWAALTVDVHPDDLKNCTCDFPARFYVHPKDYRAGSRIVHQGWVRIAGKHKSRNVACDALEAIVATRH
jgi:hypothetical protein